MDLGWAVVNVDALPIDSAILMASLEASPLVRRSVTLSMCYLILWRRKHLLTIGKSWTYLITVSRDRLSLVLQRTPDRATDLPEGLRRSAFIEMRPFLENGDYDRRFADAFYRLVPLLATGSRDYRAVNDFAPILALVRLARSQGATFSPQAVTSGVVATPDAIAIRRPPLLLLNASRVAPMSSSPRATL